MAPAGSELETSAGCVEHGRSSGPGFQRLVEDLAPGLGPGGCVSRLGASEVLEAEAGGVELVGQPGQVGELGFHVVPAAQVAKPPDQFGLEACRVAIVVVVVDDDERIPAVEV